MVEPRRPVPHVLGKSSVHVCSLQKRSRAATFIQATYRGRRARENVIQSALLGFDQAYDRISAISSGIETVHLYRPVTVPRTWLGPSRCDEKTYSEFSSVNLSAAVHGINCTPTSSAGVPERNSARGEELEEHVERRPLPDDLPEQSLRNQEAPMLVGHDESLLIKGGADKNEPHLCSSMLVAHEENPSRSSAGGWRSDGQEGVPGCLGTGTTYLPTGTKRESSLHAREERWINIEEVEHSKGLQIATESSYSGEDLTYSDGENDNGYECLKDGVDERLPIAQQTLQSLAKQQSTKDGTAHDTSIGARKRTCSPRKSSSNGILASNEIAVDPVERQKAKGEDVQNTSQNGSDRLQEGYCQRNEVDRHPTAASRKDDYNLPLSMSHSNSRRTEREHSVMPDVRKSWNALASPSSSFDATPLRGETFTGDVTAIEDTESAASDHVNEELNREGSPRRGNTDRELVNDGPRSTTDETGPADCEHGSFKPAGEDCGGQAVEGVNLNAIVASEARGLPLGGAIAAIAGPAPVLMEDSKRVHWGSTNERSKPAENTDPRLKSVSSTIPVEASLHGSPRGDRPEGRINSGDWLEVGGNWAAEMHNDHLADKTLHELEEELRWIRGALESRLQYLRSRSEGLRHQRKANKIDERSSVNGGELKDPKL